MVKRLDSIFYKSDIIFFSLSRGNGVHQLHLYFLLASYVDKCIIIARPNSSAQQWQQLFASLVSFDGLRENSAFIYSKLLQNLSI